MLINEKTVNLSKDARQLPGEDKHISLAVLPQRVLGRGNL